MKKNFTIIAGPNGAGKTTFALQLLKEKKFEFINADLIAENLSLSYPENKNFKAGREFLTRIKNCIQLGEDFIIESTLSGVSLERLVLTAVYSGYLTRIIYLFPESVQKSIQRIKIRVLKGGHDIPRSDVIRRYPRSKNNFWNIYKRYADSWFIYCNSDTGFEQVAIGKKMTMLFYLMSYSNCLLRT